MYAIYSKFNKCFWKHGCHFSNNWTTAALFDSRQEAQKRADELESSWNLAVVRLR